MSADREEQYRKLFLQEARENFEELNTLMVSWEKNPGERKAIDSIFRIVHTIKGNAMGIGLEEIATLTHVFEDLVGEIRNGKLQVDGDIFQALFRALDKLGLLLDAIESGAKVSFLGIKTKLEIILKRSRESQETETVEETPQEEPSPEEEENTTAENETSLHFGDTINIAVSKMDQLLDLTGELMIEKDRLLNDLGASSSSEFNRLNRLISDLQYSMLKVRMVPLDFMFKRFHRVVRDASQIEGKKVNLALEGVDVEIDRNILKVISESLVHVVRNAVAHGIESPSIRKEAKKPEEGLIRLKGLYDKDSVIIEIEDDGTGINPEDIRTKLKKTKALDEKVIDAMDDGDIVRQIFTPGFSNAEKVTEISGRGVGMDVVKRSVESIGGQVIIDSKIGAGTNIQLRLPSSLALKSVLVFESAEQAYAIPVSFAETVVSVSSEDIHQVGGYWATSFQGETIPLIFLEDLLTLDTLENVEAANIYRSFEQVEGGGKFEMIVVNYSEKYLALVVTRMLKKLDVLEKPLMNPLDDIKLLSGTTILGDGNVCPILDVASISEFYYQYLTQQQLSI